MEANECLIYISDQEYFSNELIISGDKRTSLILKNLDRRISDEAIKSLRLYSFKLILNKGGYGANVELVFSTHEDKRDILVTVGPFGFNSFRNEVKHKRITMSKALQDWLINSMVYLNQVYFKKEDNILFIHPNCNYSFREQLIKYLGITE